MSLQHSPPQVSNNPSEPPLPPSTQPLSQSNIGTICCLCGSRMDEKIECLLIVKCNHYFHRACIENYLSKENKCPVCMIACELADLQRVSFPVKKGRLNKNTSGAVPKQYPTRSVTRNLFNESNPSGVSNTPSRLRTPTRTDENIQPASRNESVNFLPSSNQTLSVDYNEINKMIELNITKILQNLNLIANPSQNPSVYNVPQNQSNLPLRRESDSNFYNNPNLNLSTSSYVGYQNDKVASIIQNWGLKFDGSSNGLTVEEFLYRLKSLTRDTFNSDFTIICKNLHILLVGKARDWYWRYHKQVDLINWNDFCEAIRFQYRDFKSSFDIREELRNRKQKPGETFDMFYEALSAIMDRLPTPLSELELIEIITRNLKPEIRHELLYIPIHSIPHLRKLVQMRESFLSDDYVRRNMASRNHNQFVPRRQIAEINSDSGNSTDYDLSNDLSVEALHKSPRVPCCWNCDQLGHFYEDCLQDRTVFCYGCGAKNTYKPQCPKCLDRRSTKNSKEVVPQQEH